MPPCFLARTPLIWLERGQVRLGGESEPDGAAVEGEEEDRLAMMMMTNNREGGQKRQHNNSSIAVSGGNPCCSVLVAKQPKRIKLAGKIKDVRRETGENVRLVRTVTELTELRICVCGSYSWTGDDDGFGWMDRRAEEGLLFISPSRLVSSSLLTEEGEDRRIG